MKRWNEIVIDPSVKLVDEAAAKKTRDDLAAVRDAAWRPSRGWLVDNKPRLPTADEAEEIRTKIREIVERALGAGAEEVFVESPPGLGQIINSLPGLSSRPQLIEGKEVVGFTKQGRKPH